jgi:molecular chaperone GrpE
MKNWQQMVKKRTLIKEEKTNKQAEASVNVKVKNKSKEAKDRKNGGKQPFDDSGKKVKDRKQDGQDESQADKTEVKELSIEEKLAESQDKYLRLSAEFDNYRKRTLKEKIDLTKTAGENILFSLLPVMDDFDRAQTVMESATDCEAMKEGIDLIYNKFNEFLKNNGVKVIDAMSSKFDTDKHEAITKIPAPSRKLKGKVVDVIQKGYYLNDKVIRFSKVVIGE